jgi:hypothetical protein
MANSIVDGTNINVNVFSYSSPKPHASGGKVVNLYNKHFKESLTISTPLMLTWGAQEGQEQSTGKPTGKWTMSLQFPNSEYPNADAEDFLKSMRALENKIKADALVYSKEWFGKEIKSSEVIDEKFNIMLRHPKKDETKPPTLTIKIPQWSGVWKPEIYDEDGEPLYINGKVNTHLTPLEFLKPKTHVICLIQCGGLWFINGKVSITWNLKQAMVQKPKQTMEGTCFLKPKASDKAKMKTLPPPEEVDNDEGVSTTIVDDSDDDDDEEDQVQIPVVESVQEPAPKVEVKPVEEEPAPVVQEETKPKKKIVRKSKSDA